MEEIEIIGNEEDPNSRYYGEMEKGVDPNQILFVTSISIVLFCLAVFSLVYVSLVRIKP
jgi:hypothetical protein